jgi:hypothetical protein
MHAARTQNRMLMIFAHIGRASVGGGEAEGYATAAALATPSVGAGFPDAGGIRTSLSM